MGAIINTAKTSFSGGEAAPSLYSRTDLSKYATFAKTLRNFFVHPHGGASTRPGFLYAATCKYDNKEATLFPFEYSTLQNYMIEFGEYYARFYTNGGQILSGGSLYEISTPYSETELAYINYTQSADVMFLAHPRFRPKELSRLTATTFALTDYEFTNGPFMLQNTSTSKKLKVSAVTGSVTLTATGFTFDALHNPSLWQLSHNIAGQAVNCTTGVSSGIKCGGTWRVISHGTWTGKFSIEKSVDGGSTWTNLRTFTGSGDFNANTYGTEDMSDNALPFLVRVNISSGSPSVDLSTDPFVQKGVVKITAVSAGGATATATVMREVGDTTDTIDWAEGSWSDYRGWPTVVEFHPEDRLVFANTVSEPQTSWITKTGNYWDYSRSEPLVASDGITVNLPSRKVNGINGLVPLTEMIALTSSSEWGIGSTGDVFSPTTATQKIYGYEGSYGIRPVVIGNRAIYVQSMGQVIRDLGYELQSYSFTGSDLSILSNHLFSGYTIKDMTYQQNPDRLVWCVRSDGALLSMTYMREQEVVAWTHHDTNDGEDSFESCACIPASGYDELWVIVRRGTKRYVERQVQRMASTDPEDQIFLDCAITYDGAPTSNVTGLDHLEGKTVSILADGNVLPDQVVTGGTLPSGLGANYSKVHVGLGYDCDLETLNIEVGLPNGTLQGRKVKVSQVILRLLNSRGGSVGPDSSTLHDIRYKAPTSYGTALPLVSDDLKENIGAGYTDGGRVFVRQSQPLPMTVLGILPIITTGERVSE